MRIFVLTLAALGYASFAQAGVHYYSGLMNVDFPIRHQRKFFVNFLQKCEIKLQMHLSK